MVDDDQFRLFVVLAILVIVLNIAAIAVIVTHYWR